MADPLDVWGEYTWRGSGHEAGGTVMADSDSTLRGENDAEIEAAGELLRASLRALQARDASTGDPQSDPGDVARNDRPDGALETRVDSGVSSVMREDHVYETTDWERATGRKDDGRSELFGG